ncbi:nuclear transcription factor Y subunit B-6-like [Triticum aestivum]|uniref:nuclear transcription factor Y subunit B-6-like n=1 Tax=Triticum aestivum TaxID=4565 RepID=UPI001D02BBDD|nr:nuclear transcription factor Y subunit B-6-like [Triticum aestivum]
MLPGCPATVAVARAHADTQLDRKHSTYKLNQQSPKAKCECDYLHCTLASPRHGEVENDGVPNGPTAPAPTQVTPVVREQDRLMPIANVIRIMRRALPAHAKISDDAKEAIQECVSEFISFVTGEANERCRMQHRKTVNAEDIVWALNRLGFDDYVVPLSIFLHRMRDPEAGTGGAAAGDSRAVTSAPPRAAPPVIHAVPLQAQRPMYAPPVLVLILCM